MRVTASIDLANGISYLLSYEWMIVNDGGDFQVIAWETAPGAPADSVPDQILNESCVTLDQGEYRVRRQIEADLVKFVNSHIKVVFE